MLEKAQPKRKGRYSLPRNI
uniref:Uncharacterized protein n=1 Tax=Arundo donax TaxID=35708 RepID=A0A0A9APM1_ARUDO